MKFLNIKIKYLLFNLTENIEFLPKKRHPIFDRSYKLTVGVDIHTIEYKIKNRGAVISVWEISLQERFNFIRSVFYKNAEGIIILSSISNNFDYQRIHSLIQEITSVQKLPILLFDKGKDQKLLDKLSLSGVKLNKYKIDKDSEEFIYEQIKNSVSKLLFTDSIIVQEEEEGFMIEDQAKKEERTQILDILEQHPKVFISHANENDEFEHWLNRLATDLCQNKLFVKIDIWDLKIGDNLKDFMRSGIKDSDWIVVVFTKEYLRKSNLIQTGVYFENNILNAKLFSENNNDFKIIPLLKEGNPEQSIPDEFRNLYYIDFRDESNYKENLQKLVNRIKGIKKFKRPELSQ